MLDIMRKHSKSWLIKFMLGAIVLVFVFFYGWSRISRAPQNDNQATLVSVDGSNVSIGLFKLMFGQQWQMFSKEMKDQQSREQFEPYIKQSVLNALINRQVRLNLANQLGIKISDLELTESIINGEIGTKNPENMKLYLENLEYFRMRYGLNLESLRRDDMKLQTVSKLFTEPTLLNNPEDMVNSWTFVEIEIDPKRLLDEKKITDEIEAKNIAHSILNTKGENEWNKVAKKYGLELKETEVAGISQRNKLLYGRGGFDEYVEIFTLTKENPVAEKPFELAGKIYLVRLKDVTAKKSEPKEGPSFLNSWLMKARLNANIQQLLSL
ncbi:MAG: SurA N-terminal domain-containing protein [Pseudomonadota bacterium]